MVCTQNYIVSLLFKCYAAETSIFNHREFSFTLADDVYIRYQSFEDQQSFETELCAKNPFKIDIGAVMSVR